MLEDSDRLLHTIEQVLRAGSAGSRVRRAARTRVDLGEVAKDCVDLARTRFHLDGDALTVRAARARRARRSCSAIRTS